MICKFVSVIIARMFWYWNFENRSLRAGGKSNGVEMIDATGEVQNSGQQRLEVVFWTREQWVAEDLQWHMTGKYSCSEAASSPPPMNLSVSILFQKNRMLLGLISFWWSETGVRRLSIAMNWHNKYVQAQTSFYWLFYHSIDSSIPLTPPSFHCLSTLPTPSL